MSGRVVLAIIVGAILLYLAGAFDGQGIGDLPGDDLGVPPSIQRVYAQGQSAAQSASNAVNAAANLAYCRQQHPGTDVFAALEVSWCMTAFDGAVINR